MKSLWTYSAKATYERGMNMDINEKASQCKRIMSFVDKHGSINPLQAMRGLGIMRLAARISDLEKNGAKFEHRMVTSRNRYGEKIRYMEYKKAV